MERRAAMNAKNVVAADNYGALTMGDVGEFMKSMPGISLDYTEVDATAVRIGGLDPKYSTFTVDGARMATATSNNNTGRQNSFEQMSITGIESIELNNTLTARMDADSPGGQINLRSKYAFDRTGRDVDLATRRRRHLRLHVLAQIFPRRQETFDRSIRPASSATATSSWTVAWASRSTPATTPTTSSRTVSRRTGPISPMAASCPIASCGAPARR